jgi:NDP-sugar pyrophosphorylase family protein
MQVLVLAGGIATRMKPLSDRLPKVLFPVAGRPFLDWQLELLARNGATRVLLCVSHFADEIGAHVRSRPQPLAVELVDDGPRRAGTGGAVRSALQRAAVDEHFFVTYGDSFLPVDLRGMYQAHTQSGRPATMSVHRNDGRWDASNAVVEGDRVVRYEKIANAAARPPEMRWIDFGLTAFRRDEVLAWPDPEPFDLAAPLGRLSTQGRLGAFEFAERFYEIGSPAGLAELEQLLGRSA